MKNYTWATLLRFSIRLATVVRIAILARTNLVSQFEFGLFGIVSIVLSLLEIFTETGINVFLIQEKDQPEKYLNTAWIISISRGIIISLFIIISTPFVAGFFHSPGSVQLLLVTAFVPLVRGFINPLCIRFQKNLQFRQEFYYRLAITLIETSIVLLVGFLTRSALCFVLGMLGSAIFEFVISFIVFHPWPKFHYLPVQGKQILHQGKWVTGMGLLDYIYSTGDNIIVGRILGAAPLGIYQNAYKLSTLPITELVSIYNNVSFPGFSKISHQTQLLKRVALRNFVILFFLLLIASLGLYFLASPIVLILLGKNWLNAVPAVQALAFLGLSRGLVIGFNSIFLALKKQRLVTQISAFSAVSLAITIIPFVRNWGILGAAYSAMLSSLVALPISLYYLYRVFHET